MTQIRENVVRVYQLPPFISAHRLMLICYGNVNLISYYWLRTCGNQCSIVCCYDIGRSDKMNNQSRTCKEKLDESTVQIVMTLNDIPLEVRKKAASEPIYIAHL